MDLTAGKPRVALGSDEVATLRAAGTLIEDPRRERPRYFDGRFLAARDLIRDQTYFLTREADLGQAAGSGVATGLDVGRGTGGDHIVIAPGHGVTPAGELVLLPREVRLELSDVPRAEQLSARFGLGPIPHPPLRNRTGLFVLALRPVEFSTGRVGAYPTSITGPRTHEDADVAEATAVVLVPWRDDGAQDALLDRRGAAASSIFVRERGTGLSGNVLPIAMLALQNNVVVWIDVPMVRRELGADRSDLPGLGYSPRALRLAHLMQYQQHLADLLQEITGGQGFPAREHFPVLPSAGPMPPGMIDPAEFTQDYFPAEMDVEFSIVPEDELTALVEEALTLPAIDLEAGSETLESTAVLVLAPVPRHEWRAVSTRLTPAIRRLRPAAANLVATRKPLEILRKLRVPPVLQAAVSSDPAQAEWARLSAQGNLWFVRRRNLAYRDELAGTAIPIAGVDVSATPVVSERLTALGLASRFNTLEARATPQAAIEARALLASPRLVASPTLTAAAIGELSRAETLDHAAVLRVTSELTAPGVGDGLARLENATPDTQPSRTALAEIAGGGDWRSADATAKTASSADLGTLAREVLRPQRVTDPDAVAGTSTPVTGVVITRPPRTGTVTATRPTTTGTTLGTRPGVGDDSTAVTRPGVTAGTTGVTRPGVATDTAGTTRPGVATDTGGATRSTAPAGAVTRSAGKKKARAKAKTKATRGKRSSKKPSPRGGGTDSGGGS